MQINSLSLSGFRNLSGQSLAFAPDVNWIYGDNGQGKTNLLESIHYLCTGKSHRRAPERELLGYNQQTVSLSADAHKAGTPIEIQVGFNRQGQKRIQLSGRPLRRASDYLGTLNVVAFAPDDIAMVRGEPAVRRYFLDMLLAQVNRVYLRALQDYRHYLLQRNCLLRGDRPADPVLLATYTDKLISLGANLMHHRRVALSTLSERAGTLFGELTERFGLLEIHYAASEKAAPGASDEENLRQGFAAAAERERILKQTLVGPHRDDFAIRLGEHGLRRFGSQGQCRAAAVALKLSAVHVIQAETGHWPLLLLDDIFSELDEGLRHNLSRLLPKNSQIFMASPEMYFPLQSGARFRVESGMAKLDS